MDSSKNSLLALEPIAERSGPTLPPVPLMVWHLRQAASVLSEANVRSLPREGLPLRVKRAAIVGRFLGSSLGGCGRVPSARFLTSLKGLLRSSRDRSAVRSLPSFLPV